MTNEELQAIAQKLDKMRGPGDGLGAYLGDGVTEGPPIRAKQIAEALRQLVSLRVSYRG